MNSYTHFTKKLDMQELIVEKSYRSISHCFDASNGKVNSSFAFIKKGSVILNSLGNQIQVPSGSLFYLPDGMRYNSVWSGNPEIECCSIHMVTNRYDIFSQGKYCIQSIPEFSTPETEALFDEIYSLISTDDHTSQLKAISLFYAFYANVIPYLQPATAISHNPSLIAATEYIEKHYAESFDIETLASFCCISESRLHHLFQMELKTTPIKFRNQLRIENAASDLLHSTDSIDSVAEKNGFHSTTYFREIFKQTLGISPAKYRKRSILN